MPFETRLAPLTPKQQALVVDELSHARKFKSFLKSRYRGLLEADDVEGLVELGYTEAARGWDPARDVPFDRYATRRVWGVVFDAVKSECDARDATWRAAGLCLDLQSDEPAFDETNEAVMRHAETVAERTSMAMILGAVSEADTASPESIVLERDFLERVRRALSELPARAREVIQRTYFTEETAREIAKSLGVSLSTLGREHNAAIDTLRARLVDDTG